MINTDQMALINGCIAGITKSYSDKATVDEMFLARYNKDGLRFSVGLDRQDRILTVYDDSRRWGLGFNKILEVNLGYCVPDVQPTGPQSGSGDAIEFKQAVAA